MNAHLVAILVGLLAGAAGVLLGDTLREPAAATALAGPDLSSIETRLAAIEHRLPAEGALLRTSGMDPAVRDRLERLEQLAAERGGGAGEAGQAGGEEGPLARIEGRLASIESKLEDGAAGPLRTPDRPAKRRVSLREAADALELTAQQEDELRRIYKRHEDRMIELVAGPDGDPEAVRREISEASQDPAKRAKLIGKYMPRVVGNLGAFMQASIERDQAIRETLGPEKAGRLDREFDVAEENPLGLGGSSRAEVRLQGR